MQEQKDEVQVSYFVLCDHVITEAQTSKQSLIGIYSALMPQQLPFYVNMAAALCLRVQSAQERKLIFRFTGPEGQILFNSPQLPCDWNSVRQGLRTSPFATLQIGLNLQAVPFNQPGLYTASIFCDDVQVATYPLSVLQPGRAN
jgi:hypothetical protein